MVDDIVLPKDDDSDDDRLLIRSVDPSEVSLDEPDKPPSLDFQTHAFSAPDEMAVSQEKEPVASVPKPEPLSIGNKITIRFDKFVELVAHHGYPGVVSENADEEIVISSNLLTDLANAHDRSGDRRLPLLFFAGVVVGVVLAYILLS